MMTTPPALRLTTTPTAIEVDNGRIRARFTRDDRGIHQEFFARHGDDWALIVVALRPAHPFPEDAARLYDSDVDPANRLLVSERLDAMRVETQSEDTICIALSGPQVEQRVTLARASDRFHLEVEATLAGDPPCLEYVLSPFAFIPSGTPDYTHVPAFKRTHDDVIGDRVFFAPAAIVQKGAALAALVPDLKRIEQDRVLAPGARPQTHPKVFRVPVDPESVTLPAVLDLNLRSGLADGALLACGTMDVLAQQHVFWKHVSQKGALVREVSRTQVRYGMDLFVRADAPANRGYQRIAAFLWKRDGAAHFRQPRPQALPFTDYARACYPASFGYQGYTVGDDRQSLIHRSGQDRAFDSWQEWEEDGVPVGALRLSAPQWFHLSANCAWWNNVCDAMGFFFWGEALQDATLRDKARRAVNFALRAPQSDGLSPALYDLEKRRWINGFWRFPAQGYDPDAAKTYWDWENGHYQSVSASITAGYLLEYRRHCEDIPEILPFVQRYGDFLVRHLQPDGTIPAWFDEALEPLPSLRWNADGGAHLWVLAELFRATGKETYRDAAQTLARFLIDEALPGQRWSDFEAFYSCAVKAETFFDPLTGQPARCTMSMLWAMQGLAALYDVTQDAAYLDAAAAVADFASLYQTVWAPHFIITAYPFGGFSSQLGDAEWLDQRSHRFAGSLVRIGLLTGRQDLLERGVAAARASLTLVNLPEHRGNGIYDHPNFPTGLGPENIDHEGFPQMPLRSGASWCEVGGLAAAADILRQLGGAYIDTRRRLAVGVDGVCVRGMKVHGDAIEVTLDHLLARLPQPFPKRYEIELHARGPEGTISLRVPIEGSTSTVLLKK